MWEWSEPLTPHGKKLCDEAFSGVNFWEFKIYVTNQNTFWECNVAKHERLHLELTCTLLQEEEEGLVFGGCTCGVPNKDGVPCQHMVAVVKASRIEGLTPINCMPQWWMTLHWQKQYPSHSVMSCDFNMTTLRMTHPTYHGSFAPLTVLKIKPEDQK